jgi:primosomal protein N''
MVHHTAMVTTSKLLAIRDAFLSVLASEHKRRPHRPNWLADELAAMRAAINRERHRQRLAPVDEAAVVAADRLAASHVDYASKFTLYCAELACGLRGVR